MRVTAFPSFLVIVKPNRGPPISTGAAVGLAVSGRLRASMRQVGTDALVPPRTARNSARTFSVASGEMRHVLEERIL